MLPLDHPDRIQITFDDRRLVANAGLLLPVTLAQRLGLRELVDHHLDLGNAPAAVAQVELVDAEGAEEEGEQGGDHLRLAARGFSAGASVVASHSSRRLILI